MDVLNALAVIETSSVNQGISVSVASRAIFQRWEHNIIVEVSLGVPSESGLNKYESLTKFGNLVR